MTVDTEWAGGEPTRELAPPVPVDLGPPTLGDRDDEQRRRDAYPPEVEGELAVPETLPDVLTGELLPATVENAARVLDAAREMKDRVGDVIHAATVYLAEESRRYGSRTLALDDGRKVVLSGGDSTEIDVDDLRALLAEAGCPADRIEKAIRVKVEESVDRSVLRSLGAANPDYAAAIELATRPIRTPIRASVKR